MGGVHFRRSSGRGKITAGAGSLGVCDRDTPRASAGIIHKTVETAEPIDRTLDHRLDIRFDCDVCADATSIICLARTERSRCQAEMRSNGLGARKSLGLAPGPWKGLGWT